MTHVPLPSAPSRELRDRIAEALYAHDHPGHVVPLDETGMGPAYRESADAVMAVLRGLTLRELEQLYRPNTPPSRPEPRRMAAEAPRPEMEAAATLARECTDHAAVILWCADRVRAVDGGEAVRDAADYLHDLSTRAQVDATPVTDRPAIIRWCAQQIHSMGGDSDVERAAEYLDDLAVEADGEAL